MPNRPSLFEAYKAPIAVLLALALALGTVGYRRINVALFPEVTFPKVKVIAENGLEPVDRMMVTVTKPMEDAMKRVPGLKLLRSTTSRGSCEISAFLDWNVDVAKSQTLIESRLNQIRGDLPATVQISVERMNPAILPVMGYTLEAPGKSALELRKLALHHQAFPLAGRWCVVGADSGRAHQGVSGTAAARPAGRPGPGAG